MEIRNEGAVQRHIEVSPMAVYDLVSDVTRTGEWSPECRRCEWVDDMDRGRPGAWFRGWNRSGPIRWSRLVEVVGAEPGVEFSFRTLPDRLNRDSTTWRYRLEPEGAGTKVVESYEIHRPPGFPVNLVFRLFLRHHADMRPNMTESLGRIAALLEPAGTTASR